MPGRTKTSFKALRLELLRYVQKTKRSLTITDQGNHVLKVVPATTDLDQEMQNFRGLVLRYDDPTSPVGFQDWQLI